MLERILIGCIFGLPGVAIIAGNYTRIFKKGKKPSPAYGLGGILTAAGVLAFLGENFRSSWYLILFPIVFDYGLGLLSFVISASRPKPDYAKMYITKMNGFGWSAGEDAEDEFNKYFQECRKDVAYKDIVKNKKYDFTRFCYIVAGLKTSIYLRCRENEPFSIRKLWDVTDEEFEILKEILPEELKGKVFRAYQEDKNEQN